MAFWGKFNDVADEEHLMVAAVDGENIFRHAEERRVHRARFESGETVVPKRYDRHVATRLETEMLKRRVRHQVAVPPAVLPPTFFP